MRALSEIEQASLELELLDKRIKDLQDQISVYKDAKKQPLAQNESVALRWMNEALNLRETVKKLQNTTTPDSSLPPLGDGPRRKILIEIEVTEDFEKRLDNQWMVEREIHADRWNWNWK
jgi:hypothetical protein